MKSSMHTVHWDVSLVRCSDVIFTVGSASMVGSDAGGGPGLSSCVSCSIRCSNPDPPVKKSRGFIRLGGRTGFGASVMFPSGLVGSVGRSITYVLLGGGRPPLLSLSRLWRRWWCGLRLGSCTTFMDLALRNGSAPDPPMTGGSNMSDKASRRRVSGEASKGGAARVKAI